MSALPESWVECSFASIARVVSGKNQKEVEDPLGAYPIYGSGGTFGRASDYICEAGTTVIGRKGTINSPIFVNERFWNVDTAFGLCPIDAKSLLPRLLFYYCQSFNFHSLDKSTTIPSLAKRDIEFIRFPLPPLAEQKRIVSKIEELFSELDAGEESLRRARRQLGVYRQALLKQAFEGKLTAPWRKQNPHLLESPDQLLNRIQEERQARYEARLKEWELRGGKSTKPRKPKLDVPLTTAELDRLGSLPPEWCWEKNERYLFEVKDGTHDTPKYVGSGVPFITQKHIQDGRIVFEDFKMISTTDHERFSERSNAEQGDLLISMIGKPGSCAIVRTDLPFSIKNVGLFKFFEGLQSNEFLCYFYQSLGGLGYVMKFAKGGVQPFLGLTELRFWPVPVCSLPEQQEIVRLLDEQFTVIEQNEREIGAALKRSAALRQSILKKAFTGQLVPQDPTDEPASVLLERIRKERDTGSVSKKKTALKKAKPI